MADKNKYRKVREVNEAAVAIIDKAVEELTALVQGSADTPKGRHLSKTLIRRKLYKAASDFAEHYEIDIPF